MDNTIAKIIILGLILTVVFCLFRAFYIMVNTKSKEKNKDGVANFLTLRVTFSALLIGFLILSNYMGWIQFHGPHQDPRTVQQMQMQQQYLEQQKAMQESQDQ